MNNLLIYFSAVPISMLAAHHPAFEGLVQTLKESNRALLPKTPFSRMFVLYCARAALFVSGLTGLVLLAVVVGTLMR
jgi:hypothetical protein